MRGLPPIVAEDAHVVCTTTRQSQPACLSPRQMAMGTALSQSQAAQLCRPQSPGMNPSGLDCRFLGDPGLPGSCSLHTLSMPIHTSPNHPPPPRALSAFPSSLPPPQDKFSKPPSLCLTLYRKPPAQQTALTLISCFPTGSQLFRERALVYSFHISHSCCLTLRAE